MKRFVLTLSLFLLSLNLFAQTGIIRGRVYNALTNEPLEFATVRLQNTQAGTYTDAEGNFAFEKLAPGLYNVEVTYTGFSSRQFSEIQVFNNKAITLDAGLEEVATSVDTITITASPFTKTSESPVSLRTIGVNEIERNPGGNRDISKVIQSLPGVSSTVGFRNDIIIRGGSPNENRFYLDGIEVPNINHFATQGASGGPVGMINVNFIREVDFYTGAFPANRGNTLSSIMDMKLKAGRSDRMGANVTVGSSDLGLTLEGPLGKKTTYLASARRSYLQGLFTILGLPFLPTYNDFQFKTNTKLNSKSELTVLGLGAIDQFRLNLAADSTPEQRYILNYLPVNQQWNYTVGASYKRFLKAGFLTFTLSRNMLNNESVKYFDNDDSDAANLILDYGSQEMENKFRAEHTLNVKGFRVNYGLLYEYVRYTNRTFNRISTPFGLDTLDFNSALDMHKYGAFASLGRSVWKDRLTLSLGLRTDANTRAASMNNPLEQISPRFSAALNLTPTLSFNANTGIYYQLPAYTVIGYRDANGSLANLENGLKYIRSSHVVGGLEWKTTTNARITLESFYKRYQNYPYLVKEGVSLANLGGDFGVVGNAPVRSSSEGRTWGVEFMAQQKLWKGFFGILSYTWVRSEFTDSSGTFKPSAWDNRHILTFTGGKKFAKNWELGARWRFYGGSPYTPTDIDRSLLISVWDITGRALPDYSRVSSERLPASHQLDLRVDKKWYFSKWALNLYLDVQNVYNFQSQGAPNLDVQRDLNGNPIVDPNDPSRYLGVELKNPTGTVLPSIGIVIEI